MNNLRLRSRLIRAASWLVLLPFGVGLAASQAVAMSVVEREFPALVERAEQIIVGTVNRIDGGRDAGGGPQTLVTFDQLTVLKGSVGESFTLRLAGGPTDNGVIVSIPDMPTFVVGEQAVLFVAGNGRDFCPLVGIWQGRFRVVLDPESGVEMVERHDGARVTGFSAGKLTAARQATVRTSALTLADFSSLIREEISHPSAAAK